MPSAVQKQITMPIVRALTPNDCAAYRALRQKILLMGDGRYFSDSYTREAELNENQWLAWCKETPEHCIFGTFDGDILVGIMMVTQHGAPEDRTVEWEAIWLAPEYRQQGIAQLAYQEIERWTRKHGYTHVALYIRADNHRSQEIHKRQGAYYQYTKKSEIWADGSVADTLCFRLDLAPRCATYLENTLSILETTQNQIVALNSANTDHSKSQQGPDKTARLALG